MLQLPPSRSTRLAAQSVSPVLLVLRNRHRRALLREAPNLPVRILLPIHVLLLDNHVLHHLLALLSVLATDVFDGRIVYDVF